MAEGGKGKKVRILTPGEKTEFEQGEGPADSGQKEAQQLGRGASKRDLAAEALQNDHDRSELFRGVFEKLVIALVCFLGVGFTILAVVWGINIILGPWAWLTDDQMHDLQGILTGGLLLGLVGDHVKRRTTHNLTG